ncbi:MAG: hypothetical protein ACREL7_10920 [Longimicrobiales bacterium]
MESNGGRQIVGIAAAAIIFVATGCRDSGLPDRNLPLAEAEHRRFGYELYEPSDAAESALQHEDSEWVVAGPPMNIPASRLVPAGTAGGRAVFTLANDPAPFDRLYVEGDRGWTPYARLD